MKELHVLIERERAGVLVEDRHGALSFTYNKEYSDLPDATPLSLAIPLSAERALREPLLAFLWGLLPDSPTVLDQWARQFQVSPQSVFGLLSNVGEECAGAVQFLRPERLEQQNEGGLETLTEHDLGSWLRQLKADPAAWHRAGHGQFSLAGAQAKFAVRRDGAGWSRPWGAEPTNVIVKPAAGGLSDQEINEHLCLELARAVGLTAARSRVQEFDGARAICVDRYDRIILGGELTRVHQEDLCQASSVRPVRKYQSDGGPSPSGIAQLLRENVSRSAAAEMLEAFTQALAFNWLIAGTDAHAKNYSILLSGSDVALAPLYDITSVLPYVNREPLPDRATEWAPTEIRLAMAVGTQYFVQQISGSDWHDLARALAVDGEALVERINKLAEQIPEALDEITARPEILAFNSALPARFKSELARHLGLCRIALLGRPVPGRRRS
jgi:serine/threonine-protein kinase HipA